MTTWQEFTEAAPRIAAIFTRRHLATGNLCMLATLPSDGFPRISPMQPTVFEDQLWLAGMPHTTKFRDLKRDPRFCLHTATVDTEVKEGDAKLWAWPTTSRTGRYIAVRGSTLTSGDEVGEPAVPSQFRVRPWRAASREPVNAPFQTRNATFRDREYPLSR